ncbi:MAG TPA: hypothetical protein VKA67_00995, partial [Verrucomicrobiae bacterium]|nr:hypothetical protein [Verrucomicrobiae bacterium]
PDLGEPREIRVTQTPTGQLKVGERLYQEIGPLTFAQIGKADSASDATRKHVAFRKGRDGNIVDLITDSDTFRRAIWGETRQGRLWLLGVAVFTFLLAVVLWPMIFLIRFISALTVRKPLPLTTTERRNKFSRLALATALAACILALWFEVALTWTELQLDPFADIYGIPHSVQRLFWLIPVLMFLSVALSGFAVVAWRKRLWDFAHRLHYTMIPVALILLFYVYYCQHLLFVA